MDVVIVESPAKARTINKYLGSGYEVIASYGHVRDLSSREGSVLPDAGFDMRWEVDTKARSRLAEIARAVKPAQRLILATDPDREGEAISWHLLEVLGEKKLLSGKRIERVVFNAITKNAVLAAMEEPRQIDRSLVDAYRARRALDYLVGYTLSPVLWRKLPGARSAGRVQSVALRLICEREGEIERFVPREYWTIDAHLLTSEGARVTARLVELDGRRLEKFDIAGKEAASQARALLERAGYVISELRTRPHQRHAQPPFTTSTLQQAASHRLGFGATATMRTAQRLYEGIDLGDGTTGLITYMRTDGVQIAGEAVSQMRRAIARGFGDAYLPEQPHRYVAKAKNSQEAHEAIRPTDFTRAPDDIARFLKADELKLYRLIWQRALASQMKAAVFERTTARVEARAGDTSAALRISGQILKFDGFLALYRDTAGDGNGADEGEAAGEAAQTRLPPLAEGAGLSAAQISADQHFTEPPPRYSEATLVKQMEKLGIGRPSTYASTMQTLHERDYVVSEKGRIHPRDKGRIVTAFLESFFSPYVNYNFTADLEDRLDRISAGNLEWTDVLAEFWRDFCHNVDNVRELRVSQVLDTLNRLLAAHVFPDGGDGRDGRKCPKCTDGMLSIKTSRFGAFVGCANYPACKYTRSLTDSDENGASEDADRVLGTDPQSGENVLLRSGRFGPYVQLGEDKTPKRASLPRQWPPQSIDLERALRLLSLPRDIGIHPGDGKPIRAGLGRYGPYIVHEGAYGRLETVEDVFTVGVNRAVDLLAARKAGRSAKPGARAAPAGRVLGTHEDGNDIAVHDGRYGPYVKCGKTNATIPATIDREAITLAEAIALIDARRAKAPAARASRKTTGRKTTGRKAAAGKTADENAARTAAKPARQSPAKGRKTAATPTTRKTTAKPGARAPSSAG